MSRSTSNFKNVTPIVDPTTDTTDTVNVSAINISNLDLNALGLTENDIKEIIEVKNNFGDMTGLSVAEFGKNISNTDKTSELLKLVHSKDLDVTGEKLNQIVSVATDINSSNFIGETSTLSKLPILGGMFKSVEKARKKFEMKFANTESQITNLVQEIEINQNGLKSRIGLLDGMFEDVKTDYHTLGIHIAAGKLKLEEIQAEIVLLTPGADKDQSLAQQVYDLNHVYNNLDKRLSDLYVLQQSSMQTLPMIRIIQSNNLMLIDKFYSIKHITVPAWKNQIALALSLQEQENSVKLAKAIDAATNDLLKRNATILHKNSVETAKANQRSIIDIHVLEFVQNTLIKTVNEVIAIQQDGVNKRNETTIKLKALQENYSKAVKSDAMQITHRKQ